MKVGYTLPQNLVDRKDSLSGPKVYQGWDTGEFDPFTVKWRL